MGCKLNHRNNYKDERERERERERDHIYLKAEANRIEEY